MAENRRFSLVSVTFLASLGEICPHPPTWVIDMATRRPAHNTPMHMDFLYGSSLKKAPSPCGSAYCGLVCGSPQGWSRLSSPCRSWNGRSRSRRRPRWTMWTSRQWRTSRHFPSSGKWVRQGRLDTLRRAVHNRPTMEDMAMSRDMGSAESAVLEETNMYQTDSRDLAADREAEEHEHYVRTHGATLTVSAEDPLFLENEKLEKCRTGAATYGYCAWCDAPMGHPTKLRKHYEDVHQVLIQVAPMTPPSVWQTLVGREMRARTSHFESPGGQFKCGRQISPWPARRVTDCFSSIFWQ